jgi:hypothetical protein
MVLLPSRIVSLGRLPFTAAWSVHASPMNSRVSHLLLLDLPRLNLILNATSQKLFSTPSTVMAQREHKDDPPAKRRKLDHEEVATTEHQTKTQKGLDRTISPPLSRRRSPERNTELTWGFDDVPKQTLLAWPLPASKAEERPASEEDDRTEPHVVPSPISLTRIAGLAAHQNVDAVGLGDLLGDPLIKECWNFNFLFDLDFVMYVNTYESIQEHCC